MPTSKEVSKIKQDWIKKRNDAINSKLALLQSDIYDSVIPDFLAIAKKDSKNNVTDLNSLQRQVNKEMKKGFPDVMKETVKASRALGDLNQMYFSTLVDANRLDEIRDKTNKIIDRRLGIDEDGKLKKDGFVDKTIKSDKVQKQFINEVKKIIALNGDVQLLQNKLRLLIAGGPESNGLVKQYYNTFAKDILTNIDRSNNNIYADELGLQYGQYSGGLILTSRPFCVEKNGKIFHLDQIMKWKSDERIKKMYRNSKEEYDPLINVGGPGCLHVLDWITNELAEGNIRKQNKIAATRNANFKDRHDL